MTVDDKVYLPSRRAVAQFGRAATDAFWDQHWNADDLRTRIVRATTDPVFTPAVLRYLPAGSRILEGGCGQGQIVHSLVRNGYKAVGVDFATSTVARVREAMPELDIRAGDVRHLEFADAEFDGYISAGVIEHFWTGYAEILAEMRRVVRPGGYLFVSFPFMSGLRRLKATLHRYPSTLPQNPEEYFYQYILPVRETLADFESYGLRAQWRQPYDGLKGFKDEVLLGRRSLQDLYDGKRTFRFTRALDRLLRSFAGHMMFVVFRNDV